MKIIASILIILGLLIILLTFGRPFWEEVKFRSQVLEKLPHQTVQDKKVKIIVPESYDFGVVTAGAVAGVQTVISGAGGVAGGSGEKASLLPVEATPAAGEGELGGGISTEEGEVQGEATERSSRLPFIVGGFGLLLIVAAGYFYWKRNEV